MDKQKVLDELRKKAQDDERLPLKKGATNLVFGSGNPNAEILFIGEGPGYWEDIKAEPFVGPAGALLNQLLSLIKVDRKDVFITNVIMYRPPQNRDPMPVEINAFKPYIDGIIDTINPKLIVTLGRFSMGKFLPGVFISKVHGKPADVEWKGRKVNVLPMYHPAAALRSGEVKMKLKEDFLLIPKILEEVKTQKDSEKDARMDKEPDQMKLI